MTLTDLDVEGEIPRDPNGRYFPNTANPQTGYTEHWFIGDGTIHRVEPREGKATWYRSRYVRTPIFDNPGVDRLTLALDPEKFTFDHAVPIRWSDDDPDRLGVMPREGSDEAVVFGMRVPEIWRDSAATDMSATPAEAEIARPWQEMPVPAGAALQEAAHRCAVHTALGADLHTVTPDARNSPAEIGLLDKVNHPETLTARLQNREATLGDPDCDN